MDSIKSRQYTGRAAIVTKYCILNPFGRYFYIAALLGAQKLLSNSRIDQDRTPSGFCHGPYGALMPLCLGFVANLRSLIVAGDDRYNKHQFSALYRVYIGSQTVFLDEMPFSFDCCAIM